LLVSVATRPRVLAVLVTTAALAATGLAVAPAAQAGPPGHWTRLTTSSTAITRITQPDLVRLGKNLEVVWAQHDTSSVASIRAKTITLAGKAGPLRTVVSGWNTLVDNPSVIVEKGHLLVAFGGIRTTNPSEKYNGPMAYATSSTGSSWALGSGALSHGAAYAGYGNTAVDDAGTPYVAFIPASTNRVSLHRGIGSAFPSTVADTFTSTTPGDVLNAGLARDQKTGDIWASWYNLGSNAKQGDWGVWYQKVYPTKGPLHHAPGSYSSAGSLLPDQDLAMAARPGGGVYLAYVVGYPTATKVRLLNVATAVTRDIKAPGAKEIALSPGLAGRLWVAWYDPNSSSVKAVRSNKTVSRFGAVRSAAGPSAKAYGYVYKVAIDGTKGPLDVVVNADVPGKYYQALYHTQIYAPLLVKLSKTSVKSAKGGSVTVTVTEAGSAVVGAKVTFGGVSTHTNSHGKAIVKVKKHAAKGKKPVTVSLTYYVTTKLTIKVT
jgi:hypothetical protein